MLGSMVINVPVASEVAVPYVLATHLTSANPENALPIRATVWLIQKTQKGATQRSYCVVKTFLNSPSQNTPYRTTATHLYKALMCRNLERILISQGLSTALLCYTTY